MQITAHGVKVMLGGRLVQQQQQQQQRVEEVKVTLVEEMMGGVPVT